MTKLIPNACALDRIVRAFLAIALIYLGFVEPGIVGNRLVAWLLGGVGILNVMVVFIGWCPVYALTGVRTLRNETGKDA
jgi:hypothetical protein